MDASGSVSEQPRRIVVWTMRSRELPDCPGALRPWPGGWPLPAAGGRRHHCGRRPTKPVFCSRFRRQRKSDLSGNPISSAFWWSGQKWTPTFGRISHPRIPGKAR